MLAESLFAEGCHCRFKRVSSVSRNSMSLVLSLTRAFLDSVTFGDALLFQPSLCARA